MTLRLERLSSSHRPLLDGFVNDEPDLVAYLRRWALVHQERDRLGRTWLAIDDDEPARVGPSGPTPMGDSAVVDRSGEPVGIPPVGGTGNPTRVAGFFTLAAASLDRAAIRGGNFDRLPRFPIPAVLLARLAVDTRVQGQGLGTWLFDEALLRTVTLALDGPIGFRVLITDAKNERVVAFYERRGMVAITAESWPRRMVLDLKPMLPRSR